MRLYGIIKSDVEDNSYITDISSNIDTFKKSDNVYYTDREHADVLDVYDPFEENLDADWLPYNCDIIEDNMFFKDGEYYDEGDEPEDSVEGARISKYKEGKLIEQHFKPY